MKKIKYFLYKYYLIKKHARLTRMEGEEDPREVWAAAQQAHDTHDNMGREGKDRWPVGPESLQCDRSSISFFY